MLPGGDEGAKRLDLGTHRTRPTKDTFDAVWPHRAAYGVTRIANVTGLDRIGIPVTLAIRPNARSVAVSQGKGTDLAGARASGLMEAVELWHAENPRVDLRYGSYERLRRDLNLIDIGTLPQLETSDIIEEKPILWAQGRCLYSGAPLAVPFEMVHADYCAPGYPGHGFFPASTNGLASGNHPLEAICHGLFEVVERDAISLFFAMNSTSRAKLRVDLKSVSAVRSAALLARLIAADMTVALFDITSDLGLASYYVVIDDELEDGHIGIGSGTHLDRDVALARALSEAAQTRMTYVTGSRDDLAGDEFSAAGRAGKKRFARSLFAGDTPTGHVRDTPDTINETVRDDLDTVLAAFRAANLPAPVAVDLSREGSGIHIMRTIAPGLEAPHDDPGYRPGPRARAMQ